MTATDREALTEALAHHSWCTYGQPMVSVTGAVESRGQCNCLPARQEDADSLLPVVDRIASRRTAAELREVAFMLQESGWTEPARIVREEAEDLLP